jgi:hypothetical protein
MCVAPTPLAAQSRDAGVRQQHRIRGKQPATPPRDRALGKVAFRRDGRNAASRLSQGEGPEDLVRRTGYTAWHEHMFALTPDAQRGTQDSNLEPPVLETGALAN